MSYATATDDPDFRVDEAHFRNLARFDPGVTRVHLFICVSRAGPMRGTPLDRMAAAVRLAQRNPKIDVATLRMKSNVGRDFSSAARNLRDIAAVGNDRDYVLFTNRSGYGPLKDNWYSAYVQQFNRFPRVALCGSTINFLRSPLPGWRHRWARVQTYAYLSTLGCLREIAADFPGEKATTRELAIVHGETGLSAHFLRAGMRLTCLAWPAYVFDKETPAPQELVDQELQARSLDLPFRYKFDGYLPAGQRFDPQHRSP